MTEELVKVTRLRNVDVYENMSRKQLEKIFTRSSASIPTSTAIPLPRPRPEISFPLNLKPRSR